jgi:hypothetical protein
MTHPITKTAIDQFGDVLRAERALEAAKAKLAATLAFVPERDRPFYSAETEEMQRVEDDLRGRNLPAPR